MRALRLVGSLAIGCLVTLGISCGDDDDNKGDGGTGGSGVSTGGTGGGLAGGSSGGGGSATGGTGGSSGGASFACDYNTQGAHFCWTWDAGNVPMPGPVIAAWQMACTQGMGMTVTSCPTSGAVGKCTFTSNNGGYSVAQTIYYYAPVDRATGMQLCMANNASGVTATWTPL